MLYSIKLLFKRSQKYIYIGVDKKNHNLHINIIVFLLLLHFNKYFQSYLQLQ